MRLVQHLEHIKDAWYWFEPLNYCVYPNQVIHSKNFKYNSPCPPTEIFRRYMVYELQTDEEITKLRMLYELISDRECR